MKKTPIHLVHGWTYSLDNWAAFIAELETAGFEPIMHHVPGLTTPSDEVWTVDKYVAWLREEIKDEKDPIVLGHSNGGRIAMQYDVAHPGHISHLILLDSAGTYDRRIRTQLKRAFFQPLAKVLKPLVPKGKMQRVVHRAIGAQDYGKAPENMRQTLQHMLEHDETFSPANVTARTSVIWGVHDKATPLYQGKQIYSLLQNPVAMHELEAGHSPQINHASEVVAAIVNDREALS